MVAESTALTPTGTPVPALLAGVHRIRFQASNLPKVPNPGRFHMLWLTMGKLLVSKVSKFPTVPAFSAMRP